MKELTKAEEQVMRYLWKLKKGFLKDIVEQFPEPRPAYTTISTVIRTLVRKKFIGYQTYGKANEYRPLIEKETYFKQHVKDVVKNFFGGSVSTFTSAFTDDEAVDLSELEQMKKLIEARIKKLKANDE
jgi:BlaI family penicillinase repressor